MRSWQCPAAAAVATAGALLLALATLVVGSAGAASAATAPDAPAISSPPLDTDIQALLERYRDLSKQAPAPTGPRVCDLKEPLVINVPLGVKVMPGSDFAQPPGLVRDFTWVGRNLILWGRIVGGSGSYSATWDPGDGSGPQPANVTNPNYVYLLHTYATSGYKDAVLQVTDLGTSEVVSATVHLHVDTSPPAQQTRVNAAIEDGLRYLYLQQQGNGSWSGYGGVGTATALALSSFELAKHFPNNDPQSDIYADRVHAGLEAMISTLTSMSIAPQTAGDPDFAENDDLGVIQTDGSGAYSQGIIMLALALSQSPNNVAGQGSLAGHTYKWVLANMVDQLAYSQDEYSGRGGWRYCVNCAAYGNSDNSAVQWAVIGLAASEAAPWNIQAAPFVKTELLLWLNASQCSDGCFGYTSTNYWCNLAKTGAGLYGHFYAGTPVGDARVQNALTCLDAHWCDFTDGSSVLEMLNGNFYALYAVKKAIEDLGLTQVGAHDWEDEFEKHLVKALSTVCGSNSYHQTTDNNAPLSDGYWTESYWLSSSAIDATAFALLILQPGIVCPKPIAVPVATPSSTCPGVEICFDGSQSIPAPCDTTLQCEIQQWLWDYNCDGSVDATGPNVCAPAGTFPLPPGESQHVYNVCLTVIDNSSPNTACNSDSRLIPITIGTANNPPVPVTGGPYTACVCDTIWLDGCQSFDPDASCTGDQICEYLWDLDGDGDTDFTSPTCVPDTFLLFCQEIQLEIQLRVRDCLGQISDPQLGVVRVWSSRRELSIATGDITLTRFGCDSLRVTATIHAATQDPSLVIPATTAEVFFDDPTCTIPANRICTRAIPELMNGATYAFTCTWALPDENPHDIYVVVDPAQQVLECVETDNLAGKEWGGCPQGGVMIALNDVDQTEGVDELLRIDDPATGVAALIGSLGDNFLEAEALAVEPSTGRIFVVDDARLLELDGLTGNGTEIGPVGFDDVDGIAFHPQTGVLYGVTYGSNKIIQIDTATGAGTVVASNVCEGHRLNDLAFHPTDLRAFILTDDSQPRLYDVNILTGEKLQRWILTGGSSLEALAWDPTGTILYSAADRDGFKDLVTIDLATSTIAFVSAEHSGYPDIEGLAFIVSQRTRLAESWGTLVSVGPPRSGAFQLHPNVPNPFNPRTELFFDLPEDDEIDLSIYDVAGRKVATLAHGARAAGPHHVSWAGVSDRGEPAAAGIYYAVLRGRTQTDVRPMALVK